MPVSCPAASYTMPRMEVKEARGLGVVAGAAQLACVLEASAEKPGNITPSHDFADTSYEDMLRSAIALGPELGRAAERGVGETVLAAVRATQRVAGANTNLGIALLLAPLARAALLGGPLRERAEEVLGALTLDDARAAYAAIRMAGAGGLDEPVEHDVRDEPTIALRDAMAAAAERDSVASEYATGYALTFDARAPGAGARARRRAGPAPRDGRAVPDPARRGPGHADRAQAGSRRGRAGLGRRGPGPRGARRRARGVRRLAAAGRQRAQPRHDRRPRDGGPVRRAAGRAPVILLVSVSARMLAELATREGYDVCAVDRFGDLDLQRLCPSVSLMRDLGGHGGMEEMVEVAEPIRADSVVYGAGLENRPDLVAPARRGTHAARLHPGDAAARARSGAARRLPARGRVRVPAHAVCGRGAGAGGSRAPLAAQAGPRRRWPRGARVARRPAARRRDRAGAHRRAPVLRGGGRRRPLRGPARRERAADRAPRARRPRLAVVRERRAAAAAGAEQHALADAAAAICAHLAAAFGLRGVFGVDLVWDGARPWVVEVNPRPVASLETIDAAHGVRSFAAHLEGCAGRLPAAAGGPSGAAGKAVLFATEDLRVPDTSEWTARGIRDVPHPGEAIAAGRPICTLVATGPPRRPCSPSWRRAPPRCAPSCTRWVSPSPERSATCAGCGLVCDDITAVVGDDGGLERLDRTCPLGDAWFRERVAPAPPLARIDGERGRAGPRARRGGGDPGRRARAARLRAGPDDAARRSASRWRSPRRSAR